MVWNFDVNVQLLEDFEEGVGKVEDHFVGMVGGGRDSEKFLSSGDSRVVDVLDVDVILEILMMVKDYLVEEQVGGQFAFDGVADEDRNNMRIVF